MNTMDFVALARDIAAHPEWVGKTDAEIVAVYRTPQIQYQECWVKNASLLGAFGLARTAEIFAALDALGTNPELPSSQQWQFRAVMAALNGMGINVADPETRARIGDFVAAGVLTQAEAETIRSWGVKATTYRDLGLFGEAVTEADVAIARALMPDLAEAEALRQAGEQARANALNLATDAEEQWRQGNLDHALPTLEQWKASL